MSLNLLKISAGYKNPLAARKSYPSDISREQFEIIKPLLENVRRELVPGR